MSRVLPHYAKSKTAFVCIDIQTAFNGLVPNYANCIFVANRFASLHSFAPDQTKYIVTEQYPKGLGHTVPEITIPKTASVVEKTTFSAINPDTKNLFDDVENVVIFGVETHVCVMQTVADLLDMKKNVVLCVDGVGSQRPFDRETALKQMSLWGPHCAQNSSESIMFQMAKNAKDPLFKKLSGLAKEKYPQDL